MTGHHSAAFLGSIQFELSERSSSCAGLKELAALEDATVGAMTMPNTDGAKVKPMPGADAPDASEGKGLDCENMEPKFMTGTPVNPRGWGVTMTGGAPAEFKC